MKGTLQKVLAGVLTCAMVLGAAGGSTISVQAGIGGAEQTKTVKDGVVKLPLQFDGTDNWDKNYQTSNIVNVEDVVASDAYSINAEVYIPAAVDKKANLDIYFTVEVKEVTEDGEWVYVGSMGAQDISSHISSKRDGDYMKYSITDCPFSSIGKWNEATQQDEIYTMSADKKYVLRLFFMVQGEKSQVNSYAYLDNVVVRDAEKEIYNDDFSTVRDVWTWGAANEDGKAAEYVSYSKQMLTIAKTKLTVKAGKKVKAGAKATPSGKITYKTSNKKVATVDAKGNIKGVKAGKATISVTANGVTKKISVTVKK